MPLSALTGVRATSPKGGSKVTKASTYAIQRLYLRGQFLLRSNGGSVADGEGEKRANTVRSYEPSQSHFVRQLPHRGSLTQIRRGRSFAEGSLLGCPEMPLSALTGSRHFPQRWKQSNKSLHRVRRGGACSSRKALSPLRDRSAKLTFSPGGRAIDF